MRLLQFCLAIGSIGCIKGECIVHGESRSGSCIESSSGGNGSKPRRLSSEERRDIRARTARLQPACETGDRLACTNLLADLQLLGAREVERVVAAELACRAKVANTCAFAARAIAASDPGRAVELLEVGCEIGESDACHAAAAAGSPRVFDYREARCEAGDLAACDVLAEMLANPADPRYSPDRARPLLTDACKRSTSACRVLGELEVRR